MKIPKGQSESEYRRRTVNTMAKRTVPKSNKKNVIFKSYFQNIKNLDLLAMIATIDNSIFLHSYIRFNLEVTLPLNCLSSYFRTLDILQCSVI